MGSLQAMIPVYSPCLTRDSLRYAREALDSGWISSIGQFTELAEVELSRRLGVRHAILLSNGTTAGHLLVRCVRQFHPRVRKFIVPNNVFVAAWNAILYEFEVSSLHPLDANIRTWNADYLDDPSLADANSEDTCFMVVHNLGNTVNVPMIQRRFPRALVCEDACESIFGSYEGQSAGTAAYASTLSFFGNKNITCGEGGALLTNCDLTAAAVRLMKGQGQGSTRYLHEELGFNYRMTNLQAGILLGQLERWEELREKKVRLFHLYHDRLQHVPNLEFQEAEPGTEPSRWMFGVRIVGLRSYGAAADRYRRAGIETRPMFYPISSHGHLKDVSCDAAVATLLNQECVILPSWPGLTEAQIEHIANVTEKVCQEVTT